MHADVLAPLSAVRGAVRGAVDGTWDAALHRNTRAAVLALRNEGRGGTVTSVTTDDGVELHVETDEAAGAAMTVVFVHGYSLDLTNWREQRAALEGAGTRCVFYDQRGFGRSPRGTTKGSIRLLAHDLAAVVEQRTSGPVVLVGHSMGVMVITALAGVRADLFGERVVGTVLVAGNAGEITASTFGVGAFLAPVLHKLGVGTMQGLGRVPGLEHVATFGTYMAIAGMFMCDASASHRTLRVCASMTSQNKLDVLGEYAEAMYEHDELAALPVLGRVPCAVLAAADDRFIPEYHTAQLAREIPGATLSVTEHCGHMIPIEHPAVVTGAILAVVAASTHPADGDH